MKTGYIAIHRKIMANTIWNIKPFSKAQAWIDLLLCASYKDHSFWIREIKVDVKAGQVSLSELSMCDRWGWSRNKVRRFLSYLECESQIEQQKSNVTTLITIRNWSQYQIGDTANDTANRTPNGTASDTQSIKDNKVKKGKKVIPENFIVSDGVKSWAEKGGHEITDDDIESFVLYHRAKGTPFADHDAAFKTWMRNKKKFSLDKQREQDDNRPKLRRLT